MWAEQFQGKAVHIEALNELNAPTAPATGIASRAVQTSAR
jgi:hypothetical protein